MRTLSGSTELCEALAVRDLEVGYGRDPIVKGVSVAVMSRSITAVIGPNGSGKSTLLKGLSGSLSPSRGSVTVDGRDVTGMSANKLTRLGVGYVPQQRDVFGTLTVEENLRMGGYLLRRDHVARRLDEMFQLFPHLVPLRGRLASRLSGGERKALAMARVLMLEPKVLLLDEPTAGLSPDLARALLHDQIPTLAASGVAILLVEQRALDALTVADYGCVLVAGQIQIAGSAKSLRERPDIREIFLGATGEQVSK